MAKIFRCALIDRMEFNLVAEDWGRAQEWLSTHMMEDVRAQTKNYDMDYNNEVLYEETDLILDMVSNSVLSKVDMNLGDVVVVLDGHLIGVEDFYPVEGEVGIITDYDKETDMYKVKTLNPITSGWWYAKEQLGTPTAEDYCRRLKEALAKIYSENYIA